MMEKFINIVNPTAIDLGEMLGIPMERRKEISAGLDQMVREMSSGSPKVVYLSHVFYELHLFCENTEEFIYGYSLHIQYLVRTGRLPSDPAGAKALEDWLKQKP